jgi:N-acetylglucosaminyldiphosphoundecaprenol N-acetyl-beta-D-mannosaminyltransferase
LIDHTAKSLSSMERQLKSYPAFTVLSVRVNAVQIPEVVSRMEEWISERSGCHFIAVTGMHGITEAQHDGLFKGILNSADLVVPDGMPLVWLGRCHGHALARRVYGPELMQAFCSTTGPKYRHFFYGGAPGVPDLLAGVMERTSAITVVGTFSPPFRTLAEKENEEILATIESAQPDVLWVGLSTPKQERWMYINRPRLRIPVVVGVGAAFDINTGRVRQAPAWMREHGLEWSFRLSQEPRRLWRRYLVYGSEFALRVAAELVFFHRWNSSDMAASDEDSHLAAHENSDSST